MWTGAEAYDQLMGRWSRQLAPTFVDFSGVEDGERILDIGCGTGSLMQSLLEHGKPSEVVGIDQASPYIEYGRQKLTNPKASLREADVQDLPFADDTFDRCLSLLVINFIPNARQATKEMYRVTRPGGVVTAAVWDYGDGMEMLRIMWDTAITLDPDAEPRHERNMPYCRQGELAALWMESGFQSVEEGSLTATVEFSSFDDYWTPFLTGVGPSGSYVSGLSNELQMALRERLRNRLAPNRVDSPIALQVRAWAARGSVPMN